jgi:energy-converting hydrogenase A subunit M
MAREPKKPVDVDEILAELSTPLRDYTSIKTQFVRDRARDQLGEPGLHRHIDETERCCRGRQTGQALGLCWWDAVVSKPLATLRDSILTESTHRSPSSQHAQSIPRLPSHIQSTPS